MTGMERAAAKAAEVYKRSDDRFGVRLKQGGKFVRYPPNTLSPLTRNLTEVEAAGYRAAVQAALNKLFDEQQRAEAK